MHPEQAWQAALGELQLQLTKATFDTWVKNTYVIGCEDRTFLIGVHNAYAKDWLENRLLTTIKRTLIGVLSHTVDVKFLVRPKRSLRPAQEQPLLTSVAKDPLSASQTTRTRPPAGTGLSPVYTFGTFIVGNSNRLANAAARAVAENPGKAYNPLFVYGGVGLGKTHLLHAIGNESLSTTRQVLYVSSETFTNEMINSIRTQSTERFRAKYRNNIDVLLVDDIQFIGGKESTQEEFFHTFNTLHDAGKQIIICSDRPPKAITTLEERLRSRFEWGLIADIQPPDLETRIAILRTKAELQPAVVPAEVIDLIAAKIQSNIRELEGALNRVVARARLMHMDINIDMATTALETLTARTDSVTGEQVIDAVSRHYAVDVPILESRKRSKAIALARQVAMYLLRDELHYSFPRIGEMLGGRDHSTVMYGCDKIALMIEEDNQMRRDVLSIKDELYGERVSSPRRASIRA